jgi:hypothetical protein
MALVLPLFAGAAQLLFDTTNCSMTLLVSQILTHGLSVFPATLSFSSFITGFTINPQSIRPVPIIPELSIFLPLLAFDTTF